MSTIAGSIMQQFDVPLSNYIDQTTASVAASLATPVTLGATIYILLLGMMIATGRVQSAPSEFVWNSLKIAIIVILATQPTAYRTYVTDLFFRSIPDQVGGLFIAAAGGGPSINAIKDGSAFDQLIDKCFNIGMSMVDGASWMDAATRLFGYIFIIIATIIMVLMFVVVLYAKVGLALILAVGPIFIGLALFDATRSYTANWTALIANFAILQVLIFALFGLLLSSIAANIDAAATSASLGPAIAAVANSIGSFAIALAVASQLPGIASSLAGSGIAIGSSMMGASLSAPRLAATSAGRSLGRTTSEVTRSNWERARSALRGPNTISRGR